MPASEIEVTIGSVTLNDSLGTVPFYVLKNTAELLSNLSTRRTETEKQGGHGVEDSLSFYEARVLPFEGEMYATSQANRITMQKALQSAVRLSVAQDYATDDGYVLLLITDEDGIDKQIYAKILEPPTFNLIDTGMPEARRFSFVMYAKDPTIHAQTLTTGTGPESYPMTTFTIQDGDLPTIQDGDLPTIQDATGAELVVTNAGNFGAAPIITITGPTTNPQINNTTSGKTMDFNRNGGVALLATETLEIDVAARTATKTDVSAVETDETGKLSLTSEWIYIVPGANVLTAFDDTPSILLMQCQIQFRSAWI